MEAADTSKPQLTEIQRYDQRKILREQNAGEASEFAKRVHRGT